MMGWLLSAIIDLFAMMVFAIMSAMTSLLSDVIGLKGAETLKGMAEAFPVAEEAYKVFLAGGFLICLTITVFQLFKALFGPLSEAESPVQLIVRTVFFLALIGFSIDICGFIIDIGTVPFQALNELKGEVAPLESDSVGDFAGKFLGAGVSGNVLQIGRAHV